MDWIPVVFVVFKVLVLGTGMFFAIKWHYDQGKKRKAREKRAVAIAAGQVLSLFLLSLLALGLFAFGLVRMFGLDMTMP